MKKLIALALATVTAMSCSMVAFAENTTTLTTTVPEEVNVTLIVNGQGR